MAEGKALTRETLDRLAISGGGRVALGCTEHPDRGTTAIYQDGDLRLLCLACGFETARVKVAKRELEPPKREAATAAPQPQGGSR